MDGGGTLAAGSEHTSEENWESAAGETSLVESAGDGGPAETALAAPQALQITEPAVSAIIVTYNHERYIRQALDGVLSQQTTFPFEIIISEDCSTDSTAEILEDYVARYPGRIRLMRSEVNLRDNEVLFRAMRVVRGRYITFLDGDDYWVSPNKLQTQFDFMEAHPDSAVTYHDVERVTDDGEVIRLMTGIGHRGTIADLIKGNFLGTCSVMMRQAALPEVPDWVKDMPAGDWPLYFLAARFGYVDHVEGIVARYRIHGESYWATRPLPEQILMGFCMQVEIESRLGSAYAPLFEQSRRDTARHVLKMVLNEPPDARPAATGDVDKQLRQLEDEAATARIRVLELKTRINEVSAQRSEAERQVAEWTGRAQLAEARRDEAWRHASNLSDVMAAAQAAAAELSGRLWNTLARLHQVETERQASEAQWLQLQATREAARRQHEADSQAALDAAQRRLRRIRRRERLIGIGLGLVIAVLVTVIAFVQH